MGQAAVGLSPWGSFFTHSDGKDTVWGALLKHHTDFVEEDVEGVLRKLLVNRSPPPPN